MKSVKNWASAAALAALAGTTQAALISQGNGTVLDTATNLVWLQDWNVNGMASWGTQKNWADNLNFAGSSDWALPSIGEYGALFAAYSDLTQVPEFTNVQFSDYWSGTVFIAGTRSWYFHPANGFQNDGVERERFYAVAVRTADVAAAVPEPQTLALALLALGAAGVARRSRPD